MDEPLTRYWSIVLEAFRRYANQEKRKLPNEALPSATPITARPAHLDGAIMTPRLWLRIAAALQALGVVGHNLATLSGKPMHGPQEQAVFDAMRGFQFDMMGSMCSTWDFYRGYQFSTTVTFVLTVVLLWMLSNLSVNAPRHARPLVLAIAIAQLFDVLIAWGYFFAGPGIIGGLIALSLAIATILLYRAPATQLVSRSVKSA
jgi:hypothetical protein